MKRIIFILSLIGSLNSFAQVCDLSSNYLDIINVNESFNQGEIRSEDKMVEIKRLQEDRFELIIECIRNDENKGISRQELLGTKKFLIDSLNLQIEVLDQSIKINLDHHRTEMALQLRMERDILLLETRNLEARLDSILNDASFN